MADITTIFVAGIGAAATVSNGLFGYLLARRNDAAKDSRAAAREEANRTATLAERLKEQRHERQRETLLDLQDELQKLARATGVILHHDLMTVRQQGEVFLLPDATMSDDFLAATVAVLKLKERVLAGDLRTLISEFVDYCGGTMRATSAANGEPANRIEALINQLATEMGERYEVLTARLGAYIRAEFGRS